MILRVLLFLLLTASVVQAAPTLFDKGNELYAAGKYSEAADAYQSQVKSGQYSANLFYNLANAEFHLGQVGKAMLNYRRALILEPGHAEAASNLGFLHGGAIIDPAQADAWIWGTAAAAWIGLAALVWGTAASASRVTLWSGAGIAFCAAGACLLVAQPWKSDANASIAVILQDKTRASYAPADNSSAVTNLSAGEEVRVLADRGAWLYSELPNGARGWIPAAQTERLIPSP